MAERRSYNQFAIACTWLVLHSACIFNSEIIGEIHSKPLQLAASKDTVPVGGTLELTPSGGVARYTITADAGTISDNLYQAPSSTGSGFGPNQLKVTLTLVDGRDQSTTKEIWVYHPGRLDTRFATNGVYSRNDGQGAPCGGVFDSENRLITLTRLLSGNASVQRYTTEGELDTTFGSAGQLDLSSHIVGSTVNCRGISIDSAGKIIASVESLDAATARTTHFRISQDGTLDLSFGGGDGNAIVVGTGPTQHTFHGLDSEDRILVAQFVNASGLAILRRLTRDGDPDLSFGSSGSTSISVMIASGQANSTVVGPDGIYVGGSITDSGWKSWIAKTDLNGTLDNSFGSSGLVSSFTSPSDSTSVATILKQAASGDLFGLTFHGSSVRVHKRSSNGTLDSTWGDASIPGWSPYMNSTGIKSFAMDLSNRLIVCSTNGTQTLVTRLTTSGVKDSPFSNLGSGTLVINNTQVNDCIVDKKGMIWLLSNLVGQTDDTLIQKVWN